ncbi:hypothetical protein CASFOL_013170 [Castilleja foliolosa]|uniref:Uncharacterized protein n=1 Tax=Castilleja foliolosa TaxID=1961234 RepID=A0ABD3DNC3_9LAMI
MSDQELNFFQDPQIEDSICRSMHHLSTVSHHHHHHLAAAHGPPAAQTNTGCMNSTKRQAPLSPSSFQEPVSKRATLHFPSSPSTAAAEGLTCDDSHLFGFTRLPLPHPFPAVSVTSPLRRTVSEPIHFASAINPPAPPQQSSEFSIPPNPVSRQPLQESPNRLTVLQDSFPVHYPLCSENYNCKSEADRGSARGHRLRLSLFGLAGITSAGDESENEMQNASQEAVWVEKNGECLVIRFKCPCGTGYQILLSGNDCYYKLTNFWTMLSFLFRF